MGFSREGVLTGAPGPRCGAWELAARTSDLPGIRSGQPLRHQMAGNATKPQWFFAAEQPTGARLRASAWEPMPPWRSRSPDTAGMGAAHARRSPAGAAEPPRETAEPPRETAEPNGNTAFR